MVGGIDGGSTIQAHSSAIQSIKLSGFIGVLVGTVILVGHRLVLSLRCHGLRLAAAIPYVRSKLLHYGMAMCRPASVVYQFEISSPLIKGRNTRKNLN